MKQVQIVETEDKFVNRCPQTQCTFYTSGGCQACKDCGSEPYHIDHSCQTCMDCVNVPGALRFTPELPTPEDFMKIIKERIENERQNTRTNSRA